MLQRYQVKRIGLFGSHATGRQRNRSDVDFLVEFEQSTFDNFMGLHDSLRKLFRRKIDLLTPAGVDSIRIKSVAENIKKNVVYA
ncbi:MAG: nucleotidyltransferase family protein [Terriglobia bacterium]